jgi:hypothetical protein
MRTPSVSSDHRGLASIRLQNVCGHTMVCLAGQGTSCESLCLYYNFELIERAGTNALGAMKSAKAPLARCAHNQATG